MGRDASWRDGGVRHRDTEASSAETVGIQRETRDRETQSITLRDRGHSEDSEDRDRETEERPERHPEHPPT